MPQHNRVAVMDGNRAELRKLRKLALAFAHGESCEVQLHDALIALGREVDAKHFHGDPMECCVPGRYCMVIKEILRRNAPPIRRGRKKIQLTGPDDMDWTRQCAGWYPSMRRVCRDLEQAGVETVIVRYDGFNDSGNIEWIEFHGGTNEIVKDHHLPKYLRPDGKDLSVQQLIEEFADTELSRHEPGWELEDGAYGDLSVDIKSRTAEIDHNARFTSIEGTSHDIEL